MSTAKMRFRVELHGERITARLSGRLYCTRQDRELPNMVTLHRSDGFWFRIFGSQRAVDNFIRAGRRVTVIVPNPFDPCDRVI